MKLSDLTIKQYSLLLEEKKATPGGGSALSLVLELAIDLVLMCCNFTIDKKNYENVQDEIKIVRMILSSMKEEVHTLIDEDGVAYDKLMEAYRSKDENKISKASVYACEVPYQLFKLARDTEKIATKISKICNQNLVSDALIAIDLAKSVYPGCKANINCNIDNILNEDDKNKYLEILK